MAKLTWKKFEDTVTNTQDDFENLCRVFFKYFFFGKDSKVILSQQPNNPGVEINPIMIDGERISFQSKYFSGNVNYKDILDSAEKTVKYYTGEIDKVYLFCNKDITETAQDYTIAKETLKQSGIELIPFCNRSILEIIELRNYGTIAALYFNQLNLTSDWFKKNLELALQDLAPRYIPGFNVSTDLENYFEVLFLSHEMYSMLSECISDWDKKIEKISYSLNDDVVKSVRKKIEKIVIPNRELLYTIFDWAKLFIDDLKIANENLENLEKKVQTVSKEERDDIYRRIGQYRSLCYLIESIDLEYNPYFSILKSNILILEGEAGMGKSHLIGFEADKNKENTTNRTVLLLGQKLIGDNNPEEQIMRQLGLESGFDTFLQALEAKGEIDSSITVIMLDALNECSHYKVWKEYLNTVITKISEYRYVRFLLSIRTTYRDSVLSDAVKQKINNKAISVIEHIGFSENIDEAIPAFFKHYGIPVSTTAYLGYEFFNPLFLKLYCETYQKGDLIGSKGVIQLFHALAKNEEEKIKTILNIDDSYSYVKVILGRVGKHFYNNECKSISRTELLGVTSDIPRNGDFIDKMLKGKILVSYIYDDKESVYLTYEKFSDYLVAEHIINNTTSITDLRKNIKEKLLAVSDNRFTYRYAVGVFSALTVMSSEKYGEEILDIIDDLEVGKYEKYDIVKEYIEQYPFRANINIKAKAYFDSVSKYLNSIGLIEANIDMLITMSGRTDNELNSNALTQMLMPDSLAERDYFWTILINNKYNKGDRIYNTVKYFLNTESANLSRVEKILYAQELSWFFTSSNRVLRDESSRALIKILKGDIVVMRTLLETFIEVNDPYVIQRIFGVLYGALLKADAEILDKNEFAGLSHDIHSFVFCKEEVYPDILLRDYALNILEYATYLGIKLEFDIEDCRPPYRSQIIPKVDKKRIAKEYETPKNEYPGTTSIRWSMSPNTKNLGYGDFGRYVFQSSLRDFKKVDIENLYYYALDYIKNTLGYRDDLFTTHDRSARYDRNVSPNERIGKKYQWIAMYHILAKVSDHHKYLEKYSDAVFNKYKGSWRPYVRDFDPTLDLMDSERFYDFDFALCQPRFSAWELDNPKWAMKKSGALDFEKLVCVTDSIGEEWICLNGFVKDKSSDDYEHDYQEIYKSVSAYIIEESKFKKFFSKLKDKDNFHDEHFPGGGSAYTVFAREYFWAPAYQDTHDDRFSPIHIETGNTSKKKGKFPKFDFEDDLDEYDDTLSDKEIDPKKKTSSIEILFEDLEYDEPIMTIIGRVLPCWCDFLWEEQYDYGKKGAVSYDLPNSLIVNKLGLKYSTDGIFTLDGQIICADFSLVKGTVDGLYIRKEYIERFLKENGYKIFWLGCGEKNFVKADGRYSGFKNSSFYDMNSFLYYDSDKLISINKFENRNRN